MNGIKSARYYRAAQHYAEQDRAREEAAMPETKTPEQWIAETTEEMATYSQRQAIDAINDYHVYQTNEKACKDGKEAAGRIIRQYLELNDETEIEDAERGLKAILATRRQGKDSYDVRSMTQKQVLSLWKAGCLQVDTDALNIKANAALRMDAEPQKVPAGETTYLRVIKE